MKQHLHVGGEKQLLVEGDDGDQGSFGPGWGQPRCPSPGSVGSAEAQDGCQAGDRHGQTCTLPGPPGVLVLAAAPCREGGLALSSGVVPGACAGTRRAWLLRCDAQ